MIRTSHFWWTLIFVFSGALTVATLPFLLIGPSWWLPTLPPEKVVGMFGAITIMGIWFRCEGSI